MYEHRMRAYARSCELFRALGNTSAAVHRRWNAQTMTSKTVQGVNMGAVQRLCPSAFDV
jgi:hypothetical protein